MLPLGVSDMVELCEQQGFTIERADYIDRANFPEEMRSGGRESAGVIALKPNVTISLGNRT